MTCRSGLRIIQLHYPSVSAVAAVLIAVLLPVSGFAQQSTSGPERLPGVDPGLRLYRGEAVVIIPNVPAYYWKHGCGPTSAGMVLGYWDGRGAPWIVDGDAMSQTVPVNRMIADDTQSGSCGGTGDHYADYACPEDYSPYLQPDRSEGTPTHSSNCVADFMLTSQSKYGNYYGWSWMDDVPTSLLKYIQMRDPGAQAVSQNYYYNDFSFEDYKAEIDAGRPVVLLVDTDGDWGTDHFVTGIGYNPETSEYIVHDTYDSNEHYYLWQPMGSGVIYGIYGVTTFHPGYLSMESTSGFGRPPVAVDFQGFSVEDVSTWEWDFGDGTTGSGAAASHEYTLAGSYDVSLTVTWADSQATRTWGDVVLVYDDTMHVADATGTSGRSVRVDIYARNYIPVRWMQIPFCWDGALGLRLTEVSTEGLRTDSLGIKSFTHYNGAACQATYTMMASPGSNAAVVEPGDGPVLSLHFDIPDGMTGTQPISIAGYATSTQTYLPLFGTEFGEYNPTSFDGTVTGVTSCCIGNTGNIDMDAGDNVDISDLTTLVNHLFVTFETVECLAEANTSGDATCSLDISDLTALVNNLFVTFEDLAPCDPLCE
jgi:PKD repeat protein